MTLVTRHMVRRGNPVSDFTFHHAFSDLNDLARDLMAQHQWHFVTPVPFNHIRAADATRHHSDQRLARTYLRLRPLLNTHIFIIVIYTYAHSIIQIYKAFLFSLSHPRCILRLWETLQGRLFQIQLLRHLPS